MSEGGDEVEGEKGGNGDEEGAKSGDVVSGAGRGGTGGEGRKSWRGGGDEECDHSAR